MDLKSQKKLKRWKTVSDMAGNVSLALMPFLLIMFAWPLVDGNFTANHPDLAKAIAIAGAVWVALIVVIIPFINGRERSVWCAYLDDVAKGSVVPRSLEDLPLECDSLITDFASFVERVVDKDVRVMFFREEGDRTVFYLADGKRYPHLVAYDVPVRDLRTPVEETVVSWLTFRCARFSKPGETWRFGIIPSPRNVLFPDLHRGRPQPNPSLAKT